MFKCGICKQHSKPGEKAHRVVLKRRNKRYRYRKDANTVRIGGMWEKTPDNGGQGTEIVQEVLAHEGCAAVHAHATTPNIH